MIELMFVPRLCRLIGVMLRFLGDFGFVEWLLAGVVVVAVVAADADVPAPYGPGGRS